MKITKLTSKSFLYNQELRNIVWVSEGPLWSEHVNKLVERAGRPHGFFLQCNLKHVLPVLVFACPVSDPFHSPYMDAP